jgi:hypothetical protein
MQSLQVLKPIFLDKIHKGRLFFLSLGELYGSKLGMLGEYSMICQLKLFLSHLTNIDLAGFPPLLSYPPLNEAAV